MKKLILVTSPPACGKSFVSSRLAKAMGNIVCLDKDTLIPLSKQIFKAAGEAYDRSSDFFQREIRDYEYEVIIDLALEALEYNKTVLINAPFTDEVRDKEYLDRLRERLSRKNARLVVIWVETDVETCKARMYRRNSSRDTWKLKNWDAYVSSRSFQRPQLEELIVFKNSNEEEFSVSLRDTLRALGYEPPECGEKMLRMAE